MKGQFTILGCRAGAPAAGAAASGYLVQAGGVTMLVDCGPGVALTLAMEERRPALDAVVISHRHADHCLDLLALAYSRRFPEPLPPLPLYGPPDLPMVLEGLDALFAMPSLPVLARPLHDTFAFHPVEPGDSFVVAGLVVETLAARHPVPTLALRWPATGLVYTADGALTEELVAFATGANVLLAEATYPTADGHDLEHHGHLTAVQAGELARRAGVGRLVLTHLANPADEALSLALAAQSYEGAITVAAPGMCCSCG